jgi:predicted nucleic acid-binding protein
MIITDSGFWVTLVNPDDKHHQIAVNALTKINKPLITTYPVITEVQTPRSLLKAPIQ